MARNQPFDFSDDDDIGIGSHSSQSSHRSHGAHGSHGAHASDTSYSSSPDMIGSADLTDADLLGDTGAQQSGRMGKAAKQAAQTQTATRSTTAQQHDSPTSMQHKRGNQPR
jgi:hypothetical protein